MSKKIKTGEFTVQVDSLVSLTQTGDFLQLTAIGNGPKATVENAILSLQGYLAALAKKK